ncbi:transposase [Thalassoglobus neptunius]
MPPYSPDFNPIEQVYSQLKWYLRTVCLIGVGDLRNAS